MENETVKAVEIQPVKADAELMSAWLGGMDDVFISSKLLFDLQTLLRHYADFIVPNKKVSIDYRHEGTPCASVDNNQVFIPIDTLRQGEVDNTISSVIHELHHIKFSDGESTIARNIFPFYQNILDTVEINHHGRKMSVWQALASHGKIDVGQIIERECEHTYKEFIYRFFGDLFLLMNAVEDVRIDELQPKNLMKYRFKHEKQCFEKFKDALHEGNIDTDTFHGRFLSALFHWKGYGRDSFVEKSKLHTDTIVGVETPSELVRPTFKAFAKVIQDHAGALWKLYEEQNEVGQSAISDFLVEEVAEQLGDDDNEVNGNEELQLEPKKASSCSNLDEELSKEVSDTFGESDFADMLNAMYRPDEGDNEGDESSPTVEVLSETAWAEIQSFKRLRHVVCNEQTENAPQGVEYDTLIFDCYA